jgi:hypothetical protein
LAGVTSSLVGDVTSKRAHYLNVCAGRTVSLSNRGTIESQIKAIRYRIFRAFPDELVAEPMDALGYSSDFPHLRRGVARYETQHWRSRRLGS